MGKRKRHAKQASMWVTTQDLPRSAAHPFYARLIGCFEGLDAEREIAWRAADSFALRDFSGRYCRRRRLIIRRFLGRVA